MTSAKARSGEYAAIEHNLHYDNYGPVTQRHCRTHRWQVIPAGSLQVELIMKREPPAPEFIHCLKPPRPSCFSRCACKQSSESSALSALVVGLLNGQSLSSKYPQWLRDNRTFYSD